MAHKCGRTVGAVVEAVECVVGDQPRPVLLHGPTIEGRAWDYVKDCLDTAWVSSGGAYVARFEEELAGFTGAKHAVAVVNGTAGLHMALQLAGVQAGDEVLMPALTFVATANAASHCGAVPHFLDVEAGTLGLDPAALSRRLDRVAQRRAGQLFNRETGRRLAAIVPMHTFGHPVDLAGLTELAQAWDLPVVEDAAESLGSWYGQKHTGRFGRLGVMSFNGNKILTTGGGGAILTDDEALAERARYLTSTAKRAHPWEFIHDEVGYNYRMPNLNAALGCAQLEQLVEFLEAKRKLAADYKAAFAAVEGVAFFEPAEPGRSNHWLNAVVLEGEKAEMRQAILEGLAQRRVQARPIWRPMHELPMYSQCPRAALPVTEDLAERILNLPSSAYLRQPDQT